MIKYYSSAVVFEEIPDEVTLAIEITNCPGHCEGCHSPWLREDIGEELTPEVLRQLIDENR
jgi:anaerobic ribonucleoside-triphosphate reductase activating protein